MLPSLNNLHVVGRHVNLDGWSQPSEMRFLRTSVTLFLKRVASECMRGMKSAMLITREPEHAVLAQSLKFTIHAFRPTTTGSLFDSAQLAMDNTMVSLIHKDTAKRGASVRNGAALQGETAEGEDIPRTEWNRRTRPPCRSCC